MITLILIITSLVTLIGSFFYLHKEQPLPIVLLYSVFLSALSVTLEILFLYSHSFLTYVPYLLYFMLICLIVMVEYLHIKGYQRNQFQIFITPINNVISMIIVLNLLWISTIRIFHNVHYLITIAVFIMLVTAYILMMVFNIQRHIVKWKARDSFLLTILLLLLVTPFLQTDEPTITNRMINPSETSILSINQPYLVSTSKVQSYDLQLANCEDFIEWGNYIYYIYRTPELTLYAYNLDTADITEIYVSSIGDNFYDTYIDLVPYNNYLYLSSQYGLYIINDTTVTPIYLHDISDNQTEYFDFYGALFIENPTRNETILTYETKVHKYEIDGSLLRPYLGAYNPDEFSKLSLVGDNTIDYVYRFSTKTAKIVVAALDNGKYVYSKQYSSFSSLSSSTNDFVTHDSSDIVSNYFRFTLQHTVDTVTIDGQDYSINYNDYDVDNCETAFNGVNTYCYNSTQYNNVKMIVNNLYFAVYTNDYSKNLQTVKLYEMKLLPPVLNTTPFQYVSKYSFIGFIFVVVPLFRKKDEVE